MTGEWLTGPASDESEGAGVRLSRARPRNREQRLPIKALALRDHDRLERSKGLFRRVFVSMLPTSGGDRVVKLARRAERQSR